MTRTEIDEALRLIAAQPKAKLVEMLSVIAVSAIDLDESAADTAAFVYSQLDSIGVLIP